MDMGDVTTEGAPDRGQGSRLRIDHRSGSCMDMALIKHHIQVCCVFQFLVSSGSDDCKCRRRWQIGVFGRVEGKSRSESRGFCCTCNLDDAGMEGAIKSRGSARIGSRRSPLRSSLITLSGCGTHILRYHDSRRHVKVLLSFSKPEDSTSPTWDKRPSSPTQGCFPTAFVSEVRLKRTSRPQPLRPRILSRVPPFSDCVPSTFEPEAMVAPRGLNMPLVAPYGSVVGAAKTRQERKAGVAFC